jgi:hypothetical protein
MARLVELSGGRDQRATTEQSRIAVESCKNGPS